MNILICISHVPDTTTKIKFTADGSALDKNGVQFVINPYDEFGLARALELREQNIANVDKITILCVGTAEVEPTIRKALAVGGEEGVRIDADATDGYFVAQQIAAYVKDNPQDIIMMGKESIDNNASEVPGMTAALLDMPFISFATYLDFKDGKALVTREISGGTEEIEVATPFVLSAQKGLAEWRIPNMRGIMMARKKPLNVVAPKESEAFTSPVKYEQPAATGSVEYIEPDNVKALVKILADNGVI